MGSNVEGGNVNQPGSQQQCQSAHGSTFSGQYCQVFRQQETVRYFVGICVPDSCKEEDVEMLVLYGRLQIGQTSLIPPFPSILVNQTAQALLMTHCLSNTVSPDAFEVTCLFVCSVMVAIPLAATLLTAIIRWKKNREVSPSLESSSIYTGLNLYGTLKSNGSSGSERNGGSLEEKDSTSHKPLCFPRSCVNRGLEALSLQNTSQGVLSTSSSIPGGGYSSLNGIRVLSLFWIMCGHSNPVFYNKKHWEKEVQSNPLYVIAGPGPGFLAVDTFLVLGGLLSARSLLNSINRADGKLSISMVASYLFNRIKRIQPLHLFILCFSTGLNSLEQRCVCGCGRRPDADDHCFWCHHDCAPAAARLPDNFRWQAALGWFCCLSLLAVVVGLAYVLKEEPTSLSLPHAFYQGLHRTLWALAVTWIIVACEEGYGGFIKSFLSLGFWLPLSNISFACYLSHPIVIVIYIGLQETPIHYTDLNFMYIFLGHLVLTLVLSYVLTVLIEKTYLLKYSRT
ncbi:unnamed protein product [Pleuronectes platessa]|uniref:O-acyltransferase like n=1 Tax=Pleuronectes platessa TaxID=8262 RepID=A0A9N7URG8_PLEPL|nr:unnamed protein product [Pleuronectes platessa]